MRRARSYNAVIISCSSLRRRSSHYAQTDHAPAEAFPGTIGRAARDMLWSRLRVGRRGCRSRAWRFGLDHGWKRCTTFVVAAQRSEDLAGTHAETGLPVVVEDQIRKSAQTGERA